MRNLWLLTRFLLKNGLGNNQKKNGKKKFGNRTSMYLILAVAAAAVSVASSGNCRGEIAGLPVA